MNHWVALMAVAGTWVGVCPAQLGPSPALACLAQVGSAPAQPTEHPASEGEFGTADDLLSALERSGADLESLVAGIKYDRVMTILGDRQVRLGTLYFVGGRPDPRNPERRVGRKFAILFDTLQLDDERRKVDRTYIFDGQMLIEKIPEEKLITKKRVVGEGESFDPLKIGEGPMPIPIGQKKSEILARYSAELLGPTEGLDPASTDDPDLGQQLEIIARVAPGTWQLKLLPKDAKDEFREIRLWYTRGRNGDLIPRMARTINRAEDVSFVQLINIETQTAGGPTNRKASIPASVFDVSVPDGWIEQVDDLRPGMEPGED